VLTGWRNDAVVASPTPTALPVQPVIQADGSLSPMNDVVKAGGTNRNIYENRIEIGLVVRLLICCGLIVTNFHVVGKKESDTFYNPDRL
jgi:hypothetical protein